MGNRKIRDVVVKVGEYTDHNTGETKGRFENVGALMQNDEDDSFFIMIKRTFNPAGVPKQDERSSILLNCYVPQDQREKQSDRSGGDYASKSGGESPSQRAAKESHQRPMDMDDDIPF
jgi:hypothetical protein